MLRDGPRVTSTKRSFIVTCVICFSVLLIMLSWERGIVYWSNASHRPALKEWFYKTPYPMANDSSVGVGGVANNPLSDRAWKEEGRAKGHAFQENVNTTDLQSKYSMDIKQLKVDYHQLVVPTEGAEVSNVENNTEGIEQSFTNHSIWNEFGDGFLMFVEPAAVVEVSNTEHDESETGQHHALHGTIINAVSQTGNSVDTTSVHVVEPTELTEVRDAEHNKEKMGQNPAHHSANINPSDAYLGVVAITEQLSANTYNFIQLAYMSKLWNLSIIHPVVTGRSQVSSIPQSYNKQTIPLGYIFNMTNVTNRLEKCLKMPHDFYFHNLNEALIQSSRDVLLLRFMISGMSVEMKECNEQSKNSISDVLKTLNYHVEKVREEARAVHGDDYKFHIWKAICVRASPSTPLSVSKLSSYLNNLITRKREDYNTGVMVVIPHWRKIKATRTGYYYYDPHLLYNTSTCGIESFPHSDLVVRAAREFYKSHSISRPFIGVYVRTERLIQTENRQRGYINRCLHKFHLVLERVKAMFHVSHNNIVLVSDVGPHGSNTLRGGTKKANNIMTRFKWWKIHSVHYDPKSFPDFPQLNAFVASVEKEFLSLSDVLITIGRGGFQASTADHFRARHGVDRLFVLCSNTGDHVPKITQNHK